MKRLRYIIPLALLALPLAALAAVSFNQSAIDTTANTWVACNPTCSPVNITGTTLDNTTVFVHVVNGNNAQPPYKVTVNGASTTAVTFKNRFDGAQGVSSFFLNATSSGTQSIVVQWAANNPYTHVFGAAYTGVDQTTPYANATGASNSSAASSITTTLTTSYDNSWLGGACFDSSSGTISAGSGTTFRSAGSFVTSMDSNGAKSPVGSYSLVCQRAGGSDFFITTMFEIVPVQSSPAPAAYATSTVHDFYGGTVEMWGNAVINIF